MMAQELPAAHSGKAGGVESGMFSVLGSITSCFAVSPPHHLLPLRFKLSGHSYGMDLGTGEDPKSRGYTSKTGMKSTTGDLNLGTSKAAYHVPGYSGYIPSSTSNPGKISQGQGESTRGKACDLRLFHKHNIPVHT
jgi:hypothetical protein